MFIKIKENIISITYKYHILVLILSFFRIFGVLYYMNREPILSNFQRIFVLSIRFIIYFFIFEFLLFFLHWLINKKKIFDKMIFQEKNSSCTSWKDYFIFAIVWLPSLIIKYPGAMCWDTWRMLFEFRNERITAHHSVFYTVCLGVLIDFFEKIGHPNWGLFIFVLFQYLLTVFVFGYSIQLLRKLHIKKKIIYLIIGQWLINPYIIGYQGVAIKDYPYSICLFLLTVLMIEMYIDEKEFFLKKKYFLLCLSIMGSCFLRKNGFYIIFILIMICLIYAFKHKMKYISVLIIISFYALAGFGTYALEKHYNVIPGSIGEALSLPFQQTARYVAYHDNDVTSDEQRIIDQVLDYNSLAEDYNPRISDPVKNKYKRNTAILPFYFKVWFKQFLRHPLCYLEATWAQNYYIFVPEVSKNNIVLYQDADIGYELGDKIVISERTSYYEPIFSTPAILSKWQEWVISEYNLLHQLPLINIIGNISFYIYLLICMFVVMIVNKKNLLPVFCPAIVTLMFIILGPAIHGHPRYVFPIVYSAPILLSFLCYSCYFKLPTSE